MRSRIEGVSARALSVVVGFSTLVPASAIAQDAVRPQPEVETSLDEVIVTATRRSENLQDIPVAVTSIGREQIESAGVGDTRQLMQLVPGFTGSRNQIGIQPAIRGVNSAGVSVGDESNIAFYVDGVYQPDSYANGADLVLVERVEVLRGPQGTLFGRNATGGLVNIITPDPAFTPYGRVTVEASRFRDAMEGGVKLYGTTGLSDVFAVDLAVLARGNEGYIDDLVRGGAQGEARIFETRSKLLYQPSDAAKFVLTLGYGSLRDNSPNAASVFVDDDGRALTGGAGVPGAIFATRPFTTATDVEPVIEQEKKYAALRTSFDIGDINLETTTGYWHSNSLQITDTDASTAGIATTIPDDFTIKAYSQEVRLLSGDGGPFTWIAGVFAFHEDGLANVRILSGAAPFQTALDPERPAIRAFPRIETTAYAAFAEGTYAFTPRLKLTVGGRQNYEERSFETRVVAGAASASGANETDFSKFTWRSSLLYEFAESSNVYLSYSTGFKSGVFNSFALSPNQAALNNLLLPTEPETIEGFELGLKTDLSDRFRINVALFDFSYENLQVNARASDGVSYVLQNAAAATTRGVEVEAFAALAEGLDLRIAAAYLDAKYDEFPLAQTFLPSPVLAPGRATTIAAADVSGNRLVRAPEFTITTALNYDRDFNAGRLKANLNVFYTTKVFQDFANRFDIPAHEMVNAEVSWGPNDAAWRFAVFGTNLTDVVTFQQIQVGTQAVYVNYEKPRRLGVRLTYEF